MRIWYLQKKKEIVEWRTQVHMCVFRLAFCWKGLFDYLLKINKSIFIVKI